MGAISKLDAVNHMLMSAGEMLVASLGDESGIDVGLPIQILEQSSMDFQMSGLAENKCLREEYAAPNGKLYVPLNPSDGGLLDVELVSQHNSQFGNYLITARCINGNPPYMFNVTDNTSIWPKGVPYLLEIVYKILWENLTTHQQRAIMSDAARRYQMIVQGDDIADRQLSSETEYWTYKARAADQDNKKRSIFKTGPRETLRAYHRPAYYYGQFRPIWR